MLPYATGRLWHKLADRLFSLSKCKWDWEVVVDILTTDQLVLSCCSTYVLNSYMVCFDCSLLKHTPTHTQICTQIHTHTHTHTHTQTHKYAHKHTDMDIHTTNTQTYVHELTMCIIHCVHLCCTYVYHSDNTIIVQDYVIKICKENCLRLQSKQVRIMLCWHIHHYSAVYMYPTSTI